MNLLPRLLYLFQTIPIQIPLTFFCTLKRLCRNFIWSSKQPRLNWHRLTYPKLQVGLHIPDIQKYYWVCHLSRIVDWHANSSNKDWVHIENAFTPIPIKLLPWINKKKIPKGVTSNPLINSTLTNFKAACKLLKLKPTPGPMTPLENNPDFVPGVHAHLPRTDPDRPRLKLHQLFHQGTLMTFQAMTSEFPDHHIPFYKYLLIRHFINSLKPITDLQGTHALRNPMQQSRTPKTPYLFHIHAPIFIPRY